MYNSNLYHDSFPFMDDVQCLLFTYRSFSKKIWLIYLIVSSSLSQVYICKSTEWKPPVTLNSLLQDEVQHNYHILGQELITACAQSETPSVLKILLVLSIKIRRWL